jgi:peptidoglycan/LPS O-acetylase OafA/YrhL
MTQTRGVSQPQSSQRIASLQSLRIFAAIFVLEYHLFSNYLGITFVHPGTDFFIVLVGFVAAVSQAPRIGQERWSAYLRARLIRLYVSFIPLFFIALIAKRHEADLGWALRSFLFLPMNDGRLPVISATWMISMFILFYLVFSIAFLLGSEKILIPIFAVAFILIAAHSWFNWNPDLPIEWSALLLSERNNLFIFGYIGGVVARQRVIPKRMARYMTWAGLITVLIVTLLLNVHQFEPLEVIRSLVLGIPITLCVVGLATLEEQSPGDPIVRFLTLRQLVWLGGTSYVLYLSHGEFLAAWHAFLPITPALVPLVTVGAIACGAAIYQVWEAPLLRRLNGRSRKQTRPAMTSQRATSR